MSAPDPVTAKTPLAYPALPATPGEPTSCCAQGGGSEPEGGVGLAVGVAVRVAVAVAVRVIVGVFVRVKVGVGPLVYSAV